MLETLGYNLRNALGFREVAALRQFSLLEEVGVAMEHLSGEVAESKKYVLSSLAQDLLRSIDENGREASPTIELLQKSALSCELIKDLVAFTIAIGCLHEGMIESYLIEEKKFNPVSVSDAVRVFVDTFEFAKLATGLAITPRTQVFRWAAQHAPSSRSDLPYLSHANAVRWPGDASSLRHSMNAIRGWAAPDTEHNAGYPAARIFVITLPSQGTVTLQVPASMTLTDFEVLMQMMNAWKDSLVNDCSLSGVQGAYIPSRRAPLT